MAQTTSAIRTLSASSIRGTNVVNSDGDNLGEIHDLMIDLDNGRIAYAVLSFGGILGVGDKLFAVPFNVFTIDTESEDFVLDVDKERLKEAPGFDKNDWPTAPNQDFYNEIYAYYSVTPYWTT